MRISTNQIYRRGLDNILEQQLQVSKYQGQLSSGKKVQSPSDDPVAAAKISLMKRRIAATEQLQKNKEGTQAAVSLEEQILGNTVNVVQRIRELQVQAGNSALSDADRLSIAGEAQTLLNQLLDLSNSQDGNGYFMFSGGQTGTQAFARDSSGQFIYNGDDTQRFQSVTDSMKVALSDPGSDVFMRIRNGNGYFSISQTGSANTGSGVATSGSIVNSSSYVPDDYTLQFSLNSANQLVYMVSGASMGNVIPATGNPDDAPLYTEGEAISFNGLQFTISGMPNPGDDFSITPAKNESVFSTVQRMIDNLKHANVTPADKAAIQTENNQILDQLDSSLDNLLSFQAQTGTRLNQLGIVEKLNDDLLLISHTTLDGLENADLNEAAVNLNLQLIFLQAAQQSFARIQGLTVFNYL
ncbi:flagellar hook-associated protein FlgL [Legionella birminghamensis]|uniref:Flagellar hook-associated protein 3 FlgL n=1 Tax=Legionella birminghamensis TaxID=28083 RepID=A0A378IA91_9GAMM|nr:flagellar hook-associated protein FlgL [Legionella birminghamensis]KTC74688.1 flagellar hook-associated protein FlgL [Legionella birminghamensis]STX31491.1 flagellar hook-associated protein 3 FlgL [Legionella birminghamensis]